eukprot:Hpha_TRINITY_DN9716_c0_g1::TRINITY_DN9716_c0_g1_i2::g.10411::m.10411
MRSAWARKGGLCSGRLGAVMLRTKEIVMMVSTPSRRRLVGARSSISSSVRKPVVPWVSPPVLPRQVLPRRVLPRQMLPLVLPPVNPRRVGKTLQGQCSGRTVKLLPGTQEVENHHHHHRAPISHPTLYPFMPGTLHTKWGGIQ